MRHIVFVALLGFITACAAGRAERGSPGGSAGGTAGISPFAASAVAVMQAYDMETRFREAADLGRFASERARLLKDAPGEARIQVELGRVLSRQAPRDPGLDPAEVRATVQRARQLAEASGNVGVLAAAIDAEGMHLYWNKLVKGEGEWAPIEALFVKSRELAEEAKDPRVISEALFHLGLTHQFRGNAPEAGEAYERSLSVARESRDALMQSYALRHLADLAEKRGDLDTALAWHRECLRLREQVGFRTGEVYALLAVARVLTLREPGSDEALTAVQRALRLSEAHKDPTGLRESQAALGRIHVQRREAAAALTLFEKAMASAEAHQDWLTVVEVMLDIARAHALQGDKARVEALVRRAHALMTERDLTAIKEDVEQLGREHDIALQ
ncbi:tetratricopeptide repeat protein [Pyxidicoccus sp. 3LG]